MNLKPLVTLVATLLLTGCSNLSYYSQSITGQLDLMSKRRPISEVAADETVPTATREKLLEVLKIRDFATRELALPDNDSYRIYADLDRPYAVWNAFATPEFSLQPEQWCFLMVGCLAYRGYFDERDARLFAAGLKAEGKDVSVAGIRAYSTLGWFDDPVLNTFLDLPRHQLAGLVFHELAHQQLYIDDDSAFNESFATAVQLAGVRRYLQQYGEASERVAYADQQGRQGEFLALVSATREQLVQLYANAEPDSGKRHAKAEIYQRMRMQYAALRDRWGDYRGYDAWFASDLNNAKLSAVATYRSWVPAFAALLENEHGDFAAFYRAAKRIGGLAPEERKQRLAALSRDGSPVATRRSSRVDSGDPGTAARPNRLP